MALLRVSTLVTVRYPLRGGHPAFDSPNDGSVVRKKDIFLSVYEELERVEGEATCRER
jgi:hypothetical protein